MDDYDIRDKNNPAFKKRMATFKNMDTDIRYF